MHHTTRFMFAINTIILTNFGILLCSIPHVYEYNIRCRATIKGRVWWCLSRVTFFALILYSKILLIILTIIKIKKRYKWLIILNFLHIFATFHLGARETDILAQMQTVNKIKISYFLNNIMFIDIYRFRIKYPVL